MSLIGNAILQAKLKLQSKMLKRAQKRGNTTAETKWAARLARTEKHRDAYIEFQNKIEEALAKYSRDKKQVSVGANGKISHKAGIEIKAIQSLFHAVKVSVKDAKESLENCNKDKEVVDIVCQIIERADEIKDLASKSIKNKMTQKLDGDVKSARRVKSGYYVVEYVDKNNKAATAFVHYNGKEVEVLANILSIIGRKRIQNSIKLVEKRKEKADKDIAKGKHKDLYEALRNAAKSRS